MDFFGPEATDFANVRVLNHAFLLRLREPRQGRILRQRLPPDIAVLIEGLTNLQIERLAASYPVWMSDVKMLADGLDMICAVGEMTGRHEQTSELAKQIKAGFGALVPSQKSVRTAYFIWQKPYMVVGGDTFIDDMLARCGFENLFREGNGRYPQLTPADIAAANLDLILLSSEPFPFAAKHQQAIAAEFPDVRVELVDGELFSWYGSRLLKTVSYLKSLIDHIEKIPDSVIPAKAGIHS